MRREIAKLYPPSLRAKRSNPHIHLPRHGLLAEPVIGRRFAPTRWLAMTRMGRGALSGTRMHAGYDEQLCNFATPMPAEPHPPEGVIFVSGIMFAAI